MFGFCKKYVFFLIPLFNLLVFHSCKTDEFKFDEITVKDDFGVKIITPVFTGKDKQGHILEFRDFIYDWKLPFVIDPADSLTVLKYANGSYKTIPTRLIFDPSVIIDSLEFLIQGGYSLKEAELNFIVTNSCPFPLNLELQFINLGNPNGQVTTIIPPAFAEADFSQSPPVAVKTIHNIKLDSLQKQNFVDSKKIRLSSWYDKTSFINQNDTIFANYPIDVSIVLIGTAQTKK